MPYRSPASQWHSPTLQICLRSSKLLLLSDDKAQDFSGQPVNDFKPVPTCKSASNCRRMWFCRNSGARPKGSPAKPVSRCLHILTMQCSTSCSPADHSFQDHDTCSAARPGRELHFVPSVSSVAIARPCLVLQWSMHKSQGPPPSSPHSSATTIFASAGLLRPWVTPNKTYSPASTRSPPAPPPRSPAGCTC